MEIRVCEFQHSSCFFFQMERGRLRYLLNCCHGYPLVFLYLLFCCRVYFVTLDKAYSCLAKTKANETNIAFDLQYAIRSKIICGLVTYFRIQLLHSDLCPDSGPQSLLHPFLGWISVPGLGFKFMSGNVYKLLKFGPVRCTVSSLHRLLPL